MHNVFISYSTKDTENARMICSSLEAKGIYCWIAPRNIPAGADYASEITQAIRNCQVFIVLVSENAMKSNQVANEINLATEFKKNIIPCRLDNKPMTDSFKYHLAAKQWVDICETNSMNTLASNIQIIINKDKQKEEASRTAKKVQNDPLPPKNNAVKNNQTTKNQTELDSGGIIGFVIGAILAVALIAGVLIYLVNTGIAGTIIQWILYIIIGLGVIAFGFLLITFLVSYSDCHDPVKALKEVIKLLKENIDEQK
jgi:hypothetical protein